MALCWCSIVVLVLTLDSIVVLVLTLDSIVVLVLILHILVSINPPIVSLCLKYTFPYSHVFSVSLSLCVQLEHKAHMN